MLHTITAIGVSLVISNTSTILGDPQPQPQPRRGLVHKTTATAGNSLSSPSSAIPGSLIISSSAIADRAQVRSLAISPDTASHFNEPAVDASPAKAPNRPAATKLANDSFFYPNAHVFFVDFSNSMPIKVNSFK